MTITSEVQVRRLPRLFLRFADQPEQLAAAAPGKCGLLKLAFGVDAGKTRLISSYATGPQRIQRELYLDPALPDMACAIIQSVSGGILQGDRLAMAISAGAGARVHITTQAATKLLRSSIEWSATSLPSDWISTWPLAPTSNSCPTI